MLKHIKGLSKLDLLFISIFTLVFILLATQNFILASSFDTLMLRSVDDYAFQQVLRSAHEHIIALRFNNLFTLNAYGYGWLFWIIHIVLAFPFYLLSLLGSDTLLIAMTRNISLLFMFSSCLITFKIAKRYTTDKYIPYFIVLFFLSFPFFAYAATNFKTIGQLQFFVTLTFYLTIRHDNLSKQDLKYIALSLAAVIGTKLSGLLLAPLIGVFLCDRFGWKVNRENLGNLLYFCKFFIPASILLVNPSLLLAPFGWHLFTDYAVALNYHLDKIQISYSTPLEFIEHFTSAIVKPFLNIYTLAFICLCFIAKFFTDAKLQDRRLDFFYIFVFLLASSIYLVNHVKMGSAYTSIYFSSYAFLLLLPLTILGRFKVFGVASLLLLLAGSVYINFGNIKNSYLGPWNNYHSNNTQSLLQERQKLIAVVGDSESYQPKLYVLSDYQAPMIYSDFTKNVSVTILYGDISNILDRNISYHFNFILLHKNTKAFMSDEKFNQSLEGMDSKIKQTQITSRHTVKQLQSTGAFKGQTYALVYESNKLLLFKLTTE
jgi:hypothetical protein